MQQKRLQENGVSAETGIRAFCSCDDNGVDVAFRDFAPGVGARDRPQGAIGFTAVVKVQANRQHVLQYGGWRLDVHQASFYGPGAKTMGLCLFLTAMVRSW